MFPFLFLFLFNGLKWYNMEMLLLGFMLGFGLSTFFWANKKTRCPYDCEQQLLDDIIKDVKAVERRK